MNILNLPSEILVIIIEKLDGRSLYNVYNTCNRLRDVVTSCPLCCNSPLRKSPELSYFFLSKFMNLKKLNVCGVSDLKTVLLPAVKTMRFLTTLDVTYAGISLKDFIFIVKVCPTIKDITLNFTFTFPFNCNLQLQELYPYQDAFENISNVHFVDNRVKLMNPQLLCFLLKKAKLKKLQYTLNCLPSFRITSFKDLNSNNLQFESFTIYISHIVRSYFDELMELKDLKKIKGYGILESMYPFDVLDFESYEVIIILVRRKYYSTSTKPVCYATPIFQKFFSEYGNLHLHENIELHELKSFKVKLAGNVCIMLWNKSVTKFDDTFFSNLWYKLKPFVACDFDLSSNAPVAPGYDLYVTVPHESEHKMDTSQISCSTGGRVLNYDTAFREESKIQLALMFNGINFTHDVTLSSQCEYLNKITFLSLSGDVCYSSEFFHILFRSCNNLMTLRVKGSKISCCSASIAQSLPLSQSLKNFHLYDENIDFPTLYSSMSQCKTLENVHIVCRYPLPNIVNETLPAIFENCVNLYCFFLFAFVQPSTRQRFREISRKANLKKINVMLQSYLFVKFDPYSEVFRLNLF